MATFVDAVQHDLVDCNVVVLPSYLKSNWADEVPEYGIEWPVFSWPDVPTSKQEQQPFILAINTEAVIHSGGKWLEDLMKRRRTMLTVDESVCIANFKSSISKRVLNLGQLAPIKRALSGLPTPENVLQWWPQLRFCGALRGINPYSFRNRNAVMGGYMGKKITGVRHEEELHRIIDSCSVRALKRDWLDLPEKIYSPLLEFDMTPGQTVAYGSMLDEFFVEVASGDVFADQIVHQMMKLQQLSRGFVMHDGTAVELMPPRENPALKALMAAFEQIRGKVIVFTYYEYSTRAVFDMFNDAGIGCVALRGGLGADEIRRRRQSFNQDPRVRVLVGQLSVTSKGHTLLGGPGDDRCSTSIFYENLYSRDTRSQAEDRNHRQGQDRGVVYIDLVERAKKSPTRKALLALQRKQDFVEATVNAMRMMR